MTLALIVLLPFLAAAGLAFLPRTDDTAPRTVAAGTTFVVLLLAVRMFWQFDTGQAGYQFVVIIPGLGADALGIQCRLGVDGINAGLLLMGAIVAFAAVGVTRDIVRRQKEFFLLFLVMTGGILGAFASLDLFYFYFFHELALVPTFIMIGVWGRGEERNYATFKITLYLSLGALIALIGLIALYLQMPPDQRTFDIPAMTQYFAEHRMESGAQQAIFPALMFGFGILVSLWPFHTWAPLGYGSAPTATAMLHAGVLKKFGLYGLIRIAVPLMPEGAKQWLEVLALLCLGNILYCGLVAMRQKDLNLLIGNSSVAHMGFVFLGIASLNLVGVTGAVVIMIAHGLLAALSFALSGYLFHTAQTLEIARMGGFLKRLPFIGTALTMAMLAGCGLPGFANFVGEALVFFGAWKTYPAITGLACWGALLIGAVYMLRAVRSILHGPLAEHWNQIQDVPHAWAKLPFAVLIFTLLLFGFFPRLLTEKIRPSAEVVVQLANREGDIRTRGGQGTIAAAAGSISKSQNRRLSVPPHPGPLPGGEGQGENSRSESRASRPRTGAPVSDPAQTPVSKESRRIGDRRSEVHGQGERTIQTSRRVNTAGEAAPRQ
ncbi:MAG: NADH-quinone oxidoreductase subunit M [Verrucomicrobia bacterium]|nr:NADH-quinone oxidoreductase subunit M [Verrucomicrobiota bacterium]